MKGRPCVLVALLALALGSEVALADIYPVPFSGQLLDGGVPANGAFLLTFNVYDAPVAGELLASLPESVTVANGIFHANLDFSNDFFNYPTLPIYIGISKNGDPEITPRVPIHFVPKAILSIRSNYAEQSTYSAFATVAGSLAGNSPFTPGLNFRAPVGNAFVSGPRDTLSIGVPGPGWVVVEWSGSLQTGYLPTDSHLARRIAITANGVPGVMPAFFRTVSISGADFPLGSFSAPFTVRAVFQVTSTIPGSMHTYYFWTDTLGSGGGSLMETVYTATYYPTRYDQPEP